MKGGITLSKNINNAKINVEFNEAITRENLVSGESINTLFGKIKKFLSDLHDSAFTGNADTATKLASSSSTTITIDSSAWTTNSAGGYMYTYTFPTPMPYKNFNFDIVLSTDQSAAKLQLETWSCIIADGDITQVYSESDGITTAVTFYAFTTQPSVALTVGVQGES